MALGLRLLPSARRYKDLGASRLTEAYVSSGPGGPTVHKDLWPLQHRPKSKKRKLRVIYQGHVVLVTRLRNVYRFPRPHRLTFRQTFSA